MRKQRLSIILAMASALFVPGVSADCNRPSTDYERQDCAARADRDFRRGNTETDQRTRDYLQNLQRNAEEEAEQRRRLKQQQEAEAQRAFDAERSREREAKALESVLETERIYGTPRQREKAYDNARIFYNSAMVLQNLGQDKLAESDLREAEKYMAKAVIDHPDDFGLIIEAIGESLRRQGRYDEAVPVLQRALGERKFRTHASHPVLGDVLISLGRTYTALGRFDDAESMLQRALSIRKAQYGDNSEDAAYCHEYLASLYSRNRQFEKAEAHFKEAISISTDKRGLADNNTIRRMKRLATLYRDTAENSKADTLDKKIQEAAKDPQFTSQATAPSEQENVTRAKALVKQGITLYEAGKFREATAVFREVLKLRQVIASNPASDKEALELAYFNLGMSLLGAAGYAEAESMFKQALVLRDNEPTLKPQMQFFGSREESLVRNLNGLAEMYTRQQKHDQAFPYKRRIFELQEKARGAEHLETLASLRALAENLSAQGNDKEAVLHWQRTVSLAEKLPAAQNQLPDLRDKLLTAYHRSGFFPKEAEALEMQIDWKTPWKRLNDAANAAYKARQWEEAIIQGRKALDFAEKHGGAKESRVGTSQNNLAVYYRAAKKYEQAEAHYKKALDTYASVSGADSPSLIHPLRELSSLYDLQRRFDEAEPLYRRLLALQEKKHGLEHVDVARTLSNLARLHDRKSQFVEAEPLYKRALVILDKQAKTDDEILLLDILSGLNRAYRNNSRHDDEARKIDQRYEKLMERLRQSNLPGAFRHA
jgi:tetratricopeptide (TPR) repeat protein